MVTATAASAQIVMLHEGANTNGAFERYGIGKHFLKNTYMNNKASSVTVPPGFWINLCDKHPQQERGDPSCTSLPEGEWQIRELNKRVSYINVTLPSEPIGTFPARLYANRGQQGTSKAILAAGTWQLGSDWIGQRSTVDGQQMPTWKSVTSSIWIAYGYRATISRVGNKMLGGAPGHPVQISFDAGKHDLSADFDNKVFWIKVEKAPIIRPRPGGGYHPKQ
jgi:hypothetical protein